ncbi:MAG: ATP-binding cassette domain-containing protein [Thermodesulfobacteriota bacterium]|nr:ATP-binding cassette domain-containing protein [Thermodesulfobacteriota bacterium]
MIRLEDIIKIFSRGTIDEKVAINGINLHIREGDFVTVIGSNGAGKTTALNLISGTYSPDKGEIFIDEKKVTNLPEHKRAKFLGRIFQDPLMGTASSMSIEENLAIADLRGQRRGLGRGVKKTRRKHYMDILKMLDLGLENRLKDKVSLLSGGQRQSLTLLMVTLSLPNLLLLDEHTAALDPKTAQRVMDLTKKIIQENNLTTIMVTHNMQQAIQYGNRMIMLHEGKVQFDIEGEEKKNLTVEDVVKRFGAELKDEALLVA